MGRPKATNLKFVLDLLPDRKNGLTLEESYKVLELLKKGQKVEQIAKVMDRSIGWTISFLQELKKAAKAKMTLEQYFAKGRPFRPGKKVVA